MSRGAWEALAENKAKALERRMTGGSSYSRSGGDSRCDFKLDSTPLSKTVAIDLTDSMDNSSVLTKFPVTKSGDSKQRSHPGDKEILRGRKDDSVSKKRKLAQTSLSSPSRKQKDITKLTNQENGFFIRRSTPPSAEKSLQVQLNDAKQEQERIKKDLLAAQNTVHDLQEQLRTQNLMLKEKKGITSFELDRARAEIDALKTSVQLHEANAKRRDILAASALTDVIRKAALLEMKESRRQLAADNYKYGTVVYQRMGIASGELSEFWEDGSEIKEVLEKIKFTKQRLAIAEKRRKSVQSKCKTARRNLASSKNAPQSSNTAEMPAPAAMSDNMEITMAEEMVAVEVQNLKIEEAKLMDEFSRIEANKARHMREMKRIKNEDGSRFRDLPVLERRWVLIALLGKGGFSEVWKCFDLKKYHYAAVKIHQLNAGWSDAKRRNYVKHATREFEIHQKLSHDHIVKQYDVFGIEDEAFATVLEHCGAPDLDCRLKTEKIIMEKEARSILMQILSALRYLNQGGSGKDSQFKGKKFIHYDLKPGNILFDSQGNVKITDFGLSKVLDEDKDGTSMELTSQGAGTYWYLPPECFVVGKGAPKISSKVDVWSIGVMYFQMLFGKRPFGEGKTQESILNESTILKAREVSFPSKALQRVSAEAKEFIQTCLTYDQKYRPEILKLCEHKYVVGDTKIKGSAT